MVSFKSLAVASASLASLPSAFAYIYSMSAPKTGSIGQSVPVTFNTSIYIQNYDDFGIIWGLAAPTLKCDACVGTKIGYTNLVGEGAPTVPASGSFVLNVKIPSRVSAGTYTLAAGIPFLVGASGQTAIKHFNSTITLS